MLGNIPLALGAALLWGGGDFSGGMGVKAVGGRAAGALWIVLLSHLTSLLLLTAVGMMLGLPLPGGRIFVWGLVAGVAGALSATAFYIALARGAMGTSAAVSGLLAAAIPAVVSMGSEGFPGRLRLAGFLVAGAAIWMIAAGPAQRSGSAGGTTLLAVGAGAGFGVYFVALKMAGPAGPVWAMATSRIGSLATCAFLLALLGRTRLDGWRYRARRALPWVLLTALLDTSGNLLFVAATRAGRLDIAAVLASLYPATTILLAAWTLHERPTRRQVSGMALAVGAVVLITL